MHKKESEETDWGGGQGAPSGQEVAPLRDAGGMFYEVIPGKAVGGVLTYAADEILAPGTVVEVPLGRTRVAGMVIRRVKQPTFATKKILRIIYERPLPRQLLLATQFISEYYGATLGSVVGMILPNGILRGRRETDRGEKNVEKIALNAEDVEKVACNVKMTAETIQDGTSREKTVRKAKKAESLDTVQISQKFAIPLNVGQKKALEALQQAPGATKLLWGDTGSGKTNIYLLEAARALAADKSVVVLVPEIALTSQLVAVFREKFGTQVVLLHSQQKLSERRRLFEEILRAEQPRIVIGPRSALFAPVAQLGLIVVDEEHEEAYYQENAPRYSAIRVASYLATKLAIPCILGSATPNVVDFYVARQRGTVVRLAGKAKAAATQPQIQLIDLKDREAFARNRYFSNALIAAMRRNLAAGQQTLIFHNRRGSAPLTICDHCGEELVCPECFLPLTLHADSYELVCHTCGFKMAVPTACPKCGALGLVHKGFGTKLLESELKTLFPKARIRRFDADNKREESLATTYDAVRDGEVDILIGTQLLAKGLDLPRLATVGVVQADAGLSLPCFAAEERTFQLLTQVIGRVGRGHLTTAEAIIQTFRPEHPMLAFALRGDYQGFAEYLLEKRRAAGFPPFRFVAQVAITLKTEKLAVAKVRKLASALATQPELTVSPPMPAFHEHTSKGYTWQMVVRARSRQRLTQALSGLDRSFRVTFDPPSLL